MFSLAASDLHRTFFEIVAGRAAGAGERVVYGLAVIGAVFVPAVLLFAMFAIWWERRVAGRMQSRMGPNRVGPGGWLQSLADGLKLAFKEDIMPVMADKKVYFIAMTNMSFLAAIAAIMFVGKSGSTGLSDGSGWELDVIAAVFVGGAAVSGGVGTVIGSVIGGLFMSVLSNGMFVMGVGSDWSAMIRGLVLLVAVAFDLYSKAQGRPSISGAIMRGLRSRRKETQEEEQVRPEVAKI